VPEYAVSIDYPISAPLAERQLDQLVDLLGDEPAISLNDTEIGVTTVATAAEPLAAASLVDYMFRTLTGQVDVELGRILEVEALEEDRRAARLELPPT
jgi:hypothetical protein